VIPPEPIHGSRLRDRPRFQNGGIDGNKSVVDRVILAVENLIVDPQVSQCIAGFVDDRSPQYFAVVFDFGNRDIFGIHLKAPRIGGLGARSFSNYF
jgi:hypothetical protein